MREKFFQGGSSSGLILGVFALVALLAVGAAAYYSSLNQTKTTNSQAAGINHGTPVTISNSSFEDWETKTVRDTRGGQLTFSEPVGWVPSPGFVEKSADSHSGNWSVRIKTGYAQGGAFSGFVSYGPLTLDKGFYVLSVWAKKEKGNGSSQGSISLGKVNVNNDRVKFIFSTDTTWKNYTSKPFTAYGKDLNLTLMLEPISRPDTYGPPILFDDVVLSKVY